MTTHNLRFIDRSRITQDWKCPRARYYGYELLGKGITKSTTSLPLFEGITVHDSLAAVATFTQKELEVPIDEIAEVAASQMKKTLLEANDGEVGSEEFAHEQAALVEGIIRGFHKFCWTRLMDQFPKIITIEQEMQYDMGDGLVFMAKPDLILEDHNGEICYLEYKTTSIKKEDWVNSWSTAVQLHSSVKATEQTLGITPNYVQILGLYKGYNSYSRQQSPYCHGYKRNGNPPFTKDEIRYDYKAGYKHFPVWEMDGGVKKWVDGMPDEVLTNQFIFSPPIFYNADLVEAFFRQTKSRELEIAKVVSSSPNQADLDVFFPQRFDQCQPAYGGYKCEFLKLCHGFVNDPLEEGFSFREPHHQPELEQFNEE